MVDSVMERAGAGQIDMAGLTRNIRALVAEWQPQWRERLARRALDASDFERLRSAGFLLVGVPEEFGGLWRSPAESTRTIAALLRELAHVDPSLALVCAMHPAVLNASATNEPGPGQEDWAEQRRWIFQTVLEGAFWGTMVSEPGSGGDGSKTRAEARLAPDGRYLLSGRKHFGTGSGMTSFMITTAVPEGESKPDTFYLDVRGIPWDGSAGMKLSQAWDGHGMAGTQSHAFELSDFPAIRSRRPETIPLTGFFSAECAAIILGVVEKAVDIAKDQLLSRKDLRAYEKVEWANVEMEAWVIAQVFEGMLGSIERGDADSSKQVLQGKTAIAQISETAMTRLCRIMGGGAYSRVAPYGDWFEDVRALGFLRPPWGLAYDSLHQASWA